jgi:hypothetical protein
VASRSTRRCSGSELTEVVGAPHTAIYGKQGVEIGPHASVTSELLDAIVLSGDDTEVEPDAKLPNLWSVDDVDLDRDDRIVGDVISGGRVRRDRGVSIGGSVIEQSFVPSPKLDWVVTFPASNDDRRANNGQVLSLAPGAYRNLVANPGSAIRLSAGTYFVTSLSLLPHSQLIIDDSAPQRGVFLAMK